MNAMFDNELLDIDNITSEVRWSNSIFLKVKEISSDGFIIYGLGCELSD